MRWLIWLVLAIVAFVALAVACLSAVVYLPQTSGIRQSVASRILSTSFDHEIEVNGSVDISLGDPVALAMTDIRMVPVLGGSGEHVDRGEMAISLPSLLAREPVITRLALSGAHIEIQMDARAGDPAAAEGSSFAAVPSTFLKRRLAGDLTLSDVSLRFLDPDSGLDEVLDIASLRSQYTENGERIEIAANGTLNKVAFGFNAFVDDPRRGVFPLALETETSLPGNKSAFTGSIDIREALAVIDGQLRTQIGSIGDILDAFGLKRVIDGTGSLAAQLTGPLNSVSVAGLAVTAENDDGNTFAARGQIADLSQGRGLDITFSGVLEPDETTLSIDAPLADYRITGYKGHLGGDFEAMQVDHFSIDTNAFSIELRSIGPIFVDRIAKDTEGRLGILGIHVLNGPADAPSLDLSGSIADALDVSGIDLTGSFNIETANALSLEGGPGLSQLGRLVGDIAISDADGTLGIESFAGKVHDSDLIELDVSLVADELEDLDEIAIDVDLGIADFDRFAAALGDKANVRGGLNFSGRLKIANEVPTLDGHLTVNRSSITGSISAQRSRDTLSLTGSVKSDMLAVADFRNLWQVNLIGRKQDVDYIVIKEQAFDNVEMDIGIDAKRIAEAGKSVGNIKGRIHYAKDLLKLDPLAVTYLGGNVHATASLNLAKSPAALSTSGHIRKLQLGRLLSAWGAQNLATGSLNAEFKISGTAARNAFARTASGTLTASLWGGSIGSNLVDLTGLDYVSWAFSHRNDQSTRLVCAVMPLRLERGAARTTNFIVETDNVMLVGHGTINLAKDTVDLDFQPIPKNRNTITVATPFSVTGSVRKPDVEVDRRAKGQRVAAELVGMPFNFFANLFRGATTPGSGWEGKPCVVPKSAAGAGPR